MSEFIYTLIVVAVLGPVLLLKMLTARLDRIETDIRIIEGLLNELSKQAVEVKARHTYLEKHLKYLGSVFTGEVSSELEVFDRRLSAVQRASGISDEAHTTRMLEGRKQLVKKLHENLLELEKRRVEYGLHAPIELENDIKAHQHAIERLQDEITSTLTDDKEDLPE